MLHWGFFRSSWDTPRTKILDFFFLEFERIQVDHWRILFILHLTFFTGIPGLLSTQLLPQEPWHVEDQKTLGTRLAFHCFAVPITTTEK